MPEKVSSPLGKKVSTFSAKKAGAFSKEKALPLYDRKQVSDLSECHVSGGRGCARTQGRSLAPFFMTAPSLIARSLCSRSFFLEPDRCARAKAGPEYWSLPLPWWCDRVGSMISAVP